MNDDIQWITRGGKHIPITNIYMNDKIKTNVSKSKRAKNIVYEEKYKNADIQVLIDKKGYKYKTKMANESKFFYDEGYIYDFKQQAIDEARKSIDRRS